MTAALTERDQLEDDLEELDPSEYADEDEDDLEDDDAPPPPVRNRTTTKQQHLRRTVTAQHSATQTGLLELVSTALAAKVAHDVDAHPLALEALDAFTATAQRLRAAIETEQQTIRETEETNA